MVKKPTKQYLQLLNDECPNGHRLAIWVKKSNGQKFVGCSEFPKCKYAEKKSLIDYIRDDIEIPLTWRLKKTISIEEAMNLCQSRTERQYLLGAIHFIGTDDFDCAPIEYKNARYFGLVFPSVFRSLDFDSYSPTSLAIVPQVKFGEKLHHDFGIFTSDEKLPKVDEWHFEIAVEIDYHPSHEWNPSLDNFRDSIVNYKVLRILRDDKPLTWFKKVKNVISSKFLEG